tara:strand:+ start:92 stop:295 length:204 start_codon:yes stop_codon:yes gene_type:complete
MKNILDPHANKLQSIIKLEIVKDNLEGVHQALSMYEKPKLEKSISLVDEILDELKKELDIRRNNKHK